MDSLTRGLYKAIEILVACALGGIVILVVIQVASRYLLHDPTSWSEELTRYLFVWASMLGTPVALRKGRHLAVDLLPIDRLPRRGKAIYEICCSVVVNAYLAVLLVAAIQLLFVVRDQRSVAMGISMAIPYGAIAAGVLLMLLDELASLARRVLLFSTSPADLGAASCTPIGERS